MTTIGDIIFALVWFGALIFGIRLMSNGWSLMSQRERKEEWESKPPSSDIKKAVQQSTHPELQDLGPGDELMIVNFVDEDSPIDKDRFKLDSPELHNLDEVSLHKSLQDRIDKLREENKKDDEDDDDGGAGVVLSR